MLPYTHSTVCFLLLQNFTLPRQIDLLLFAVCHTFTRPCLAPLCIFQISHSVKIHTVLLFIRILLSLVLCSHVLLGAAMWHFLPTHIMKDWSHPSKTERRERKEKYTGHWAAVSLTCIVPLSSVVVLIGAKLSTTQQSTTDTHTEAHSDRQAGQQRSTKRNHENQCNIRWLVQFNHNHSTDL